MCWTEHTVSNMAYSAAITAGLPDCPSILHIGYSVIIKRHQRKLKEFKEEGHYRVEQGKVIVVVHLPFSFC